MIWFPKVSRYSGYNKIMKSFKKKVLLTVSMVVAVTISMAQSERVTDSFLLEPAITLSDSVVTFELKAKYYGKGPLTIYEGSFSYCEQAGSPNCFSLQRKLNSGYFWIVPTGTGQHVYDHKPDNLEFGESYTWRIEINRKNPFNPFETGEYAIYFRISALVNNEEVFKDSKLLYFKIDR